MSRGDYTRRRMLRQLGTASIATVPAVSGCLDSGSKTDPETSSSPSSSSPSSSSSSSSSSSPTSNSTSDATDEPETDTLDPDAWTEYGPKPYAQFSPQPDKVGGSTSHLTATLPTVALQHSSAFGDAEGQFAADWVNIPPGANTESTYFNIWTNSTRCIGGAFDKEPIVDRFEAYSLKKLDPYREFDLYAGSTSGIMLQVTAVKDGWMLITFPSEIPNGKQQIRHLIDLCLEETTPYYQSGEPFTDLVKYLPQGVYTRVYPDVSELDPRFPREQIETAGEALLFDGEREPATGIIVLRLRDDIDDPKSVWKGSSEPLTSFTQISFRDSTPELRVPDEHILVLEEVTDPEEVF